MMRILVLVFLSICIFGCTQTADQDIVQTSDSASRDTLVEHIMANNQSASFSCTLTSEELQERRNTVLASLRKKILEKKELKNGYAFRFEGSDLVIDELTEFIKSERVCCAFFVFNLSVGGDKSEAWLELTGPEGVKDVIANELEL